MSVSKTSICNFALSHLGISKRIANVDTEKSAEAAACRVFYDEVRDLVLRDFEWPFATQFQSLTLLEEDPTSEWKYSYQYPADCLKFRRILSGYRVDTEQTKIPFKIAQDSGSKIILTDQEDAECEFTIQSDNPEIYPPDFVLAFSLRLGMYLAPTLSGGDPFKIADKLFRLYAYEMGKTQANAINEGGFEQTKESEFISGRE